MTETKVEQFKRINSTQSVYSGAWTVNGRPIKSEGPDQWNFMRVKLNGGHEFLLSAEEVKEIGEMKWA